MSLRASERTSVPLYFAALLLVALTQASDLLGADLSLRFTHRAFASARSGDTLRFECSGLPVLRTSDVAVSDYCGEVPQVDFEEDVYVATNPLVEGFRSRMTCRFSARDSCGRVGSLLIYMLIVDRTPPLLENVPPDLILAPGLPLPTPPPVFAVDNCTRSVPVSFRQDSVWSAPRRTGNLSFKRIWSARDEAGNVTIDSQRISWLTPTSPEPCPLSSLPTLPTRVTTFDCELGYAWCTDAYSATKLFLDGTRMLAAGTCTPTSAHVYALGPLRARQATGPFEVVWHVQPGVYRARLRSLDSLLGFMQRSAPGADWRLVAGDSLLGDASARYGALVVVDAATGFSVSTNPTEIEIVGRQRYFLPVGTRQLVLESGACRDTTIVEVVCSPVQERRVTVLNGLRGTHCVQAPAPADTYAWTLLEAPEAAVVSQLSVTALCFEFLGSAVGTTRALYERCHVPTGQCERIGLTIQVISARQVTAPTLRPDVAALAYNGQALLEVLSNDEFHGEITSLKISGNPRGSVRVDARKRLHYTAPADWCGEDTFGYIACNEGGCRDTEVRVQVACDKLIVFSGMSPNGDGANDAFTVLGIENYPTNKLSVFNQHGLEVYHTEGYANNWLGDSRGTPLSDGTYYYVLDVEGFDLLSGYVQIRR